jgi:hypothetical protein
VHSQDHISHVFYDKAAILFIAEQVLVYTSELHQLWNTALDFAGAVYPVHIRPDIKSLYYIEYLFQIA